MNKIPILIFKTFGRFFLVGIIITGIQQAKFFLSFSTSIGLNQLPEILSFVMIAGLLLYYLTKDYSKKEKYKAHIDHKTNSHENGTTYVNQVSKPVKSTVIFGYPIWLLILGVQLLLTIVYGIYQISQFFLLQPEILGSGGLWLLGIELLVGIVSTILGSLVIYFFLTKKSIFPKAIVRFYTAILIFRIIYFTAAYLYGVDISTEFGSRGLFLSFLAPITRGFVRGFYLYKSKAQNSIFIHPIEYSRDRTFLGLLIGGVIGGIITTIVFFMPWLDDYTIGNIPIVISTPESVEVVYYTPGNSEGNLWSQKINESNNALFTNFSLSSNHFQRSDNNTIIMEDYEYEESINDILAYNFSKINLTSGTREKIFSVMGTQNFNRYLGDWLWIGNAILFYFIDNGDTHVLYEYSIDSKTLSKVYSHPEAIVFMDSRSSGLFEVSDGAYGLVLSKQRGQTYEDGGNILTYIEYKEGSINSYEIITDLRGYQPLGDAVYCNLGKNLIYTKHNNGGGFEVLSYDFNKKTTKYIYQSNKEKNVSIFCVDNTIYLNTWVADELHHIYTENLGSVDKLFDGIIWDINEDIMVYENTDKNALYIYDMHNKSHHLLLNDVGDGSDQVTQAQIHVSLKK